MGAPPMMPDGVLSTTPQPAIFVGARNYPISKIVDYEDGGIALNDASQGLLYQRWKALLFNSGEEDSYIQLSATEVPAFKLIELPRLTEISISFDTLMRPTLAYVQDGVAYLRWYDSAAADYVTDTIGAGVLTPRVSLDDKRFLATNGYQTNDVILAYVRDRNLYVRIQRERYLIEHLLAEDCNPLIKIGMNRQLRLQFMFEV